MGVILSFLAVVRLLIILIRDTFFSICIDMPFGLFVYDHMSDLALPLSRMSAPGFFIKCKADIKTPESAA